MPERKAKPAKPDVARAEVFCAIDRADLDEAAQLARKIESGIDGLKLGLEFFVANGPDGVRRLRRCGRPLFLDLKLHDIPNTVAAAVRSAGRLKVRYMTVHASGGRAMLEAAVKAAQDCPNPPRLLAVTVLTSLDDNDLAATGVISAVGGQVHRLADLAVGAGLDGLVCSPHEVALLREHLGTETTLVVPGIRPASSTADDQKRTMTPAEAQAAGADVLVVGRPITEAPKPKAAAKAIRAELADALS